jgi:hypothetical protein
MNILAEMPRQKEWEAFMDRFQLRIDPDNPSEKWQPMEKIFQLTECK